MALQAKSRVCLRHVALLGGAETHSSATISLISAKQPIGGVREWFECPRCRRACRVLSEEQSGQIYMPQVNALLLVGVLFLVLMFRSSSHLASAYGIAVTGTMVVTAGWRLSIFE